MEDYKKRIYPGMMKTCLQEILDEGITENPVPVKESDRRARQAVYFIAMEFERLGKKQKAADLALIQWNGDKVRPRLDEKDLVDLVDWVYNRNRRKSNELGCKGKLRDLGFCKKEIWGGCPYLDEYFRLNQDNRYDASEYDKHGWPKYLEERFKNGYAADRVYRELRSFGSENGIGQDGIIYAGGEAIALRLRRKERDFKPKDMTILSAIHTLEKAGLVKKLERGVPGHSGKANGYKIIYPIPKIPE